ncbi:hypothetical protein HY404_00850 [Candidatus Microgenomates bacterium]|nr:hypothetical protein [Candidatus Microgenomates bacterium]
MRYILKVAKYYPQWIILILALIFNYGLRLLLLKPDGHDYFYEFPFARSVRYSDYLFQKWNLVLAAVLVGIIWLWKEKKIFRDIRQNIPYIIIIALVTLAVHWFSFQRWFEFDDYRVIGHHYAVTGTPKQNEMGAGNSYFYGIGMIYLVVSWFGTKFELYNGLGLTIYFLTGVVIFAIANKFQKDKFISLTTALFFITSPTYWRQTLLMLELLGDGFKLLLFSLSIYFLLSRYYSGAIIFAAAALEFGISRTHFIAWPLLLMSILFVRKNNQENWKWIIACIFFMAMSLSYIPLMGHFSPQILDGKNWLNNWPQIMRMADMIFGITIPHGISHTLIYFLQWLFGYKYTSTLLGFLITVGLAVLTLWLFRKRKFLAAQLILTGLFIVVAAIIFPTLMGIRLLTDIHKLTWQYKDSLPAGPTAYGAFSTFGFIFILLGISKVLRQKLFIKILVILILLNSFTVIKADKEWIEEVSGPQRITNEQLAKILPADGQVKIIYTPKPTQVLSRYIYNFYQLYRIKEPIYSSTDTDEFISLINQYKPNKEKIYLLTLNTDNYVIYDNSDKLRIYEPTKLTPSSVEAILKSL